MREENEVYLRRHPEVKKIMAYYSAQRESLPPAFPPSCIHPSGRPCPTACGWRESLLPSLVYPSVRQCGRAQASRKDRPIVCVPAAIYIPSTTSCGGVCARCALPPTCTPSSRLFLYSCAPPKSKSDPVQSHQTHKPPSAGGAAHRVDGGLERRLFLPAGPAGSSGEARCGGGGGGGGGGSRGRHKGRGRGQGQGGLSHRVPTGRHQDRHRWERAKGGSEMGMFCLFFGGVGHRSAHPRWCDCLNGFCFGWGGDEGRSGFPFLDRVDRING